MSPRTERTWICVDGARGVCHRVDVVPHSRELKVEESEVLPLGVSRSDALDKARSLALWWGRTRLFSWWAPAVELGDTVLLHKIYILDQDANGLTLGDSLSGETITL
jgi:hypothetical protein